jgi:hypothetical protein
MQLDRKVYGVPQNLSGSALRQLTRTLEAANDRQQLLIQNLRSMQLHEMAIEYRLDPLSVFLREEVVKQSRGIDYYR